ncbi:MAG: hypothetical protein FWE38_03735 [Firmicutes bacterium]|nr:hypothetical protein [Bacillota bacterium]
MSDRHQNTAGMAGIQDTERLYIQFTSWRTDRLEEYIAMASRNQGGVIDDANSPLAVAQNVLEDRQREIAINKAYMAERGIPHQPHYSEKPGFGQVDPEKEKVQ